MPANTETVAADEPLVEEMRLTPAMEQYNEIKNANPDNLLFYRMGDFYELFFEDAEVASRTLSIMLTKRGKHAGKDIPLCGVPVKQADSYLQRLIAAGHRVAVAEQLEDPAEARKRGAKAVVRRDVVRLITPGTLFEDDLLEPRRANHLVAIARYATKPDTDVFGLAAVDISTGLFHVTETDAKGLPAELARLEPVELAASDEVLNSATLLAITPHLGASLSPLAGDLTDAASAERRLMEAYALTDTAGLGDLTPAQIGAAAIIVSYVARTQRVAAVPLQFPSRTAKGGFLEIDAATRANLEITRTLGGQRAGSVLSVVDRTVTAAGARLLNERIASPLTDVTAIQDRHDSVAHFVGTSVLRQDIRNTLKGAPDLMRSLQRLALQRGGPRDLACIRDGLERARQIGEFLNAHAHVLSSELTVAREAVLAPDIALTGALGSALADELPLRTSDGGFVRAGFNADLDEQRSLRDDSRRVIIDIQARYVQETGAKTLRIKHTNFLGYFVEVPLDMGEVLRQPPFNMVFVHRQTLQSAMRFSTTELSDLEARIAAAAERALAMEKDVFDDFCQRILKTSSTIKAAAHALAVLDVTLGFAELAAECQYVRPKMDTTLAFDIRNGRHPVVEQALKGNSFVANSCNLSPPPSAPDAGCLWLLTGPNMAGKSTFLRQNALIVLLAQAGSFVPALSAHIGVVDRLFSRVGAADDLARGRSTFMVEMVETAAILNQATQRSLVILDEIGRGTATFDGLSIAWATLEHLHDAMRCRTLFATHYHELTHLGSRLPRLHNATAKVTEWKGDVVFLHEIISGAADRSYGIQVAKLAGLPPRVVARARNILVELEKTDRSTPLAALLDDLPLFTSITPAVQPDDKAAPFEPEPPHPALDALAALKPDDLSPREALDALYTLKRLVNA